MVGTKPAVIQQVIIPMVVSKVIPKHEYGIAELRGAILRIPPAVQAIPVRSKLTASPNVFRAVSRLVLRAQPEANVAPAIVQTGFVAIVLAMELAKLVLLAPALRVPQMIIRNAVLVTVVMVQIPLAKR